MPASRKAAVAASLALSALAAPPALAAPGDLDPTFGGDGMVQSRVGSGDATLNALVLDGGRIVGAGSARGAGGNPYVALTRWLANGGRDPSFGTNGSTVVPYPAPRGPYSDGSFDYGSSVAHGLTASGGRLVTAGSFFDPGGMYDNGLATAHGPNGALDPSFDGDGIATGGFARVGARDVTAVPGGRVVAVGYAHGLGRETVRLRRYLPNGGPDTSFAGDGEAEIPWFAGGDRDQGHAVIADGTDGAVVFAGSSESVPAGEPAAFLIGRVRTDGTLDPAFGTGGGTRIPFAGVAASGRDLARTADGGFVIAGSTSDDRWALAKVTSSGALDTSFGEGGRVVGPAGLLEAVAVDGTGRIVAAGRDGDGNIVVARFLADGSPDTAFGTGGVSDLGVQGVLNDVAVTPDGRIVAGGTAFDGDRDTMTVVRLDGTVNGSSNSGGGATDEGTIGGPGSGIPDGDPGTGGGKTSGKVSVRLISRRVTKRGVLVRVTWPRGTRGTARVRVRTLAGTRLGQRTVAARSGTGRTFRVRLNGRAKRMLSDGRRMRVRLELRITGLPSPDAR